MKPAASAIDSAAGRYCSIVVLNDDHRNSIQRQILGVAVPRYSAYGIRNRCVLAWITIRGLLIGLGKKRRRSNCRPCRPQWYRGKSRKVATP